MSKDKNKVILENIMKENYLSLNKSAIVQRMLKSEIAGQRVFYLFLQQNGYDINPVSMDKNRSDGIVGNVIIECKLNENEGGGIKKAYKELFNIIPTRLKQNGEKIPFYRIYIELETFLVEVYDCHCVLKDKFDWYDDFAKFKKYFYDTKETFEYDLTEEDVDLVEVIQNIYKYLGVTTKMEAYKVLSCGIAGWFKPFDFKRVNINRLILNNDRMNEKYVQKMQGAFFTPPRYVKISTQYVYNAITDAYKMGYDNYVIVDRCAGVGNLESQFDENVYSHLILGTLNEAEAFTANIRFNGLAEVNVVDALSEDGVNYYIKAINNYKIKHKVKKLAVIFLENPPYAQTNSNKSGGIKSNYNKTYVHKNMIKGGEDLDEQFVFSAFEYYGLFRYIHYGPIKIWKSRHLITKEVKDAYLCNRKYFNASESAIALLHWTNTDSEYDKICFDNDIDNNFVVYKVYKTISELYSDEGKEKGICVVEARNFSFASPRLTGSINDNEKYGKKWVSKKNLPNVLPLFCASRDSVSETGKIDNYIDYRIIDTVYKSSDGGIEYQNDNDFKQDCMLYCLCSHKNSCSSDSKFWKVVETLLDVKYKASKIYQMYKILSKKTGINGLANIERYNKNNLGKLWYEHELYPTIKELKLELDKLHINKIRPKLLLYKLLR